MIRGRAEGDRARAGAPDLRLEVPYRDEEDFFARLGDRVGERGLRFPSETLRPLGSAVKVALELRNGRTLAADGVVDAHVRLGGRPGVNVKIVRFQGGPGSGRAPSGPPVDSEEPPGVAAGDEPLEGLLLASAPAVEPVRAPSGAVDSAEEPPGVAAGDEPLDGLLLADVPEVEVEPVPEDEPEVEPEAVSPVFASGSTSGDIVAAVRGRTFRARRAALALVGMAVVVAGGGLAASRWLPAIGPERASAAHVEEADRLVAEGRLVGSDGAIAHLLAAKRLGPADAAVERRLSHIADLLEGLAARALERGDVAVALIHLGWAEQAAPDRASIRATLHAIARRAPARGTPAPPRRRGAGTTRRR